MIRRWLREPLVHFLAAGAAIWLGFALWGEPVDPASRTIVLSKERQADLALGHERMMGRAPTDAELDTLIDRFIREEVLYREALRLGLDRDDAVVRRRLASKMDALATASAETEQVDEPTLARWRADHSDRFAQDGGVSFDQAYFPTEQAARAALEGGEVRGEPIALPASVEDFPRRRLVATFGRQFAREVDALAVAPGWQGPIPSGFGWHLVRLSAQTPGAIPPLAQIHEAVEADWRSATIAARRERAYRLLRDAYRVERE